MGPSPLTDVPRNHNCPVSPACQRMVKKAIAEKLLKAHKVPRLDETGATYQVEVSLLKDEAVLTIDTSGSGLHKRGYRPVVGRAPLRETLAAGLILLSFWKPGRPFLDPFLRDGHDSHRGCHDRAQHGSRPGDADSWAEDWATLDSSLWNSARQQAKDLIRPKLEERIIGTDIGRKQLSTSRASMPDRPASPKISTSNSATFMTS